MTDSKTTAGGEGKPLSPALNLLKKFVQIETEDCKSTLAKLYEKRESKTWILGDEIDLVSTHEKLNLLRRLNSAIELANSIES